MNFVDLLSCFSEVVVGISLIVNIVVLLLGMATITW